MSRPKYLIALPVSTQILRSHSFAVGPSTGTCQANFGFEKATIGIIHVKWSKCGLRRNFVTWWVTARHCFFFSLLGGSQLAIVFYICTPYLVNMRLSSLLILFAIQVRLERAGIPCPNPVMLRSHVRSHITGLVNCASMLYFFRIPGSTSRLGLPPLFPIILQPEIADAVVTHFRQILSF